MYDVSFLLDFDFPPNVAEVCSVRCRWLFLDFYFPFPRTMKFAWYIKNADQREERKTLQELFLDFQGVCI